MMFVFLGVGLWFTLGTGFWQARHIGLIFKGTFGRMFKNKKSKGISSFQAMSTALASTVGTGNVAGVATAITAGGPGAIFWMWVSAFLGMMTKYAEVTLAVHYRYKDRSGKWRGGPMVTIERGMGRKWKWLAVLFSFFGLFASLGVGNITQVNTMAEALQSSFKIPALTTGIFTMALAAFVILGGIDSIAKVSEFLVPFMAGIYIIASVIVLFIFRENILPSLTRICTEAFRPAAAVGGVAGYTVMRAMQMGVGRGVFSNEAGLGSAPIAHAQAEVDNPAEQGLWGAMEVFLDTILICTMTALVILCAFPSGGVDPANVVRLPFESGMNPDSLSQPFGGLDGAALTSASFSAALGHWGGAIVSICTTLFALATILGWAFYGEQCCAYLCTAKWAKTAYRCTYLLLLLPGAILHVDIVWGLADFFNSLMALPNIVSLLALSGIVFRLTREYRA